MIGAGDRRVQHVVGQFVQFLGRIGHVMGDDVDHLVVIFDAAAHLHQPRAHDHAALLLLEVGPYDEVDDPRLILQRDEAHPLGRSRPLADQDHARDMDHGTELARAQIAGAHEAALGEAGAQEGHRMRLQAQPRRLVISHDLLAQRHMWQGGAALFRPFVARGGMGE